MVLIIARDVRVLSCPRVKLVKFDCRAESTVLFGQLFFRRGPLSSSLEQNSGIPD
jgi:hypothetical protein